VYAPPKHEGALDIVPDKDAYIVEKQFVMGLSHVNVEEALELPLVVANVRMDKWSR
jgi:hypothetical protein